MKVKVREGFSTQYGDALVNHTAGAIDLTADEVRANAHKLEAVDSEARALLSSSIAHTPGG
jgi:hypothetical protein